ncbi:MAG: acyl carrier protein [Bacteroidetes bacterium]|nr:MAG: acyl carrier protein [Bacteroidota bacterium]
MNEKQIIDKINDFLIDEFEVEAEEISPDANLRETLDLDSLDYIDLVVVIENNFGFKVEAEDFKDIHTFEDFYRYILARIQANQEA